VCRIDSRGHVNRFLRRVSMPGATVPPRGAEVARGDKVVGAITSAAAVPGEERVIALAMVRREVEPPAEVTVRWDGADARAVVLA
jgi:glycine cleavage system aminomethyltransferase T